MTKEEYWKEKKENTEIKLKFASCHKCNKSTYVSNNLKIGVTLYAHNGRYYCLQHHPTRIQLSRDHYGIEFSKAIDKMRRISGIKTGQKKLHSRERKIRI